MPRIYACKTSSFDWAIVHAGLHHCASPHRGLLEMCRVARKGVVVMEARDSMLIRLAARVGLVPNYELETVAIANFAIGGLRNSAIPNYDLPVDGARSLQNRRERFSREDQ